MSHCYYLNGSQKIDEGAGFKFFSNEEGVALYEKRADDAVREIENIFEKYSKFIFRDLKSEELAGPFGILENKLVKFSDLYRKTESANTDKLKELNLDFGKIAKIRFKLRENFSTLFYIFVGKLLKEIARRNRLAVKRDLFFYDFDELITLTNYGRAVSESVLKERRRGYAVLKEGTAVKLFPKEDSEIMWKKINSLMFPSDRSEIRGSVVFGGRVRGRAKIIFQSFNKKISNGGYGVRGGDIIVTNMTTPDMIIACRRAGGIVTDEGGIICHASIIARELKKPCIVGTKIATQVLKDGDMVEVDADRGIVRILK